MPHATNGAVCSFGKIASCILMQQALQTKFAATNLGTLSEQQLSSNTCGLRWRVCSRLLCHLDTFSLIYEGLEHIFP